jgi:hypothetical protein
MQEGHSGGVTKQWPWQQLCVQSVSKLVAGSADSIPRADHQQDIDLITH